MACLLTAIAVAGLRTSAASNASPSSPVSMQGPGLFYIVTSTVDNTDIVIHGGTGTSADPFQMSSLRGAVLNANTQITSVVGPITIRVPAGTYNLSVSNPEDPVVFGTTAFQDIEVGSSFNHQTTIIGVGGTPHIVQTVAGNDVFTTGFADAFYTPQAVDLTLNNLEISGGGFSGIFTGVDNATGTSNTTVISCNIHNNSNPFGQGGGIFNQTGSLSVQGTTFSNNGAASQGGGIYYSLPNAVGPGSTGNLVVSGSRFEGNTAAVGAGFPAGGAIFVAVASTGNTLSVTNSGFENNAASGGGSGGAIANASNDALSVTLSRFYANVASSGGSALANQGSGAVSAINNWWGCDDFPGAAGCDTVSGIATTSPRIDLVLTSNPAAGCQNSSATLTADFTRNSDNGVIAPTSLDGETVSFALVSGPAGSSVSPATAIISGAMATSNFNAGGSSGTATVSATLDNGTETESIEVNANTTASDPADQTVCQGAMAAFSTTATGGNLHYAWTLDGDPFGGDTSSINVDTTSLSLGAHTVGLTVTGDCGTVTHEATLTVNQDVAATDPADVTVCQGATAGFSTTASGTGPFTYAWTVDGSPAGNTPSINVDTTALSLGAHTVEVTVTGSCGSATQSATLTVQENASTTDPGDQTVCEGATATFSTTASGVGPFSYAWTVDGSPFGGDSPTINVPTSGFSSGNHTVSVTVTAAACGTATQTATLTVNANTTATDPEDATACEGAMANFSTTATGTNLTYAWTVDGSPAGTNSPSLAVNTTGFTSGNHSIGLTVTGECGTVTHTASLTVNENTTATDPADATVCQGAMANFSTTASGTNISYAWTLDGNPTGSNSPNLAVDTTSLSPGNHSVGLTVTGTCGTVTHSAALTVNAPTATTDPVDQSVCEGGTAVFSTTASGTGPFSFVWKKGAMVLVDGDFGGRVDITSTATTSTLTISGAQPTDIGTYTVETTGACGTASQSANLAVDSGPPVITTNGQSYTMWPPNHKYQTFNITQFVTGASDSCDPNVDASDVVIASVTSDEPEDNPSGADGNTVDDIVIAANCKSVQLRAERDGNLNGRVYTITFKVSDSQGNVGTATAKVFVPKNNNGTAVDSGPQYTVNGICP